MLTQGEILRAYMDGTDIHELYAKRYRQTLTIIGIIAAPFLFLAVYYVKSALGINLFDFHLWDLI